MKMKFLFPVLLSLMFFSLESHAGGSRPYGLPTPCDGKGTSVVASAYYRKLYLCEDSVQVGAFAVSFGRGGFYKTKEGDLKTPIGTYPLKPARPSKQFGLFIHVGYPTADEVAKGYTGGDIGIHGPHRFFMWAGVLNTILDWTRGCLALRSDAEITEVAKWVDLHPDAPFHILDDRPEPNPHPATWIVPFEPPYKTDLPESEEFELEVLKKIFP